MSDTGQSACKMVSSMKSNEGFKKTSAFCMQTLVTDQIFTKAMDSYIYPADFGIKHFWCMDCGDKFIFKSSYDFHINRSSLKITILCRVCKSSLTFQNRCKLLSHIRSHVYQITEFNLSDIQIFPLYQNTFNFGSLKDDPEITSVDVKKYLEILRRNSDCPPDSESQNSPMDSLLAKIDSSFNEANKYLDDVFNNFSETEDTFNEQNIDATLSTTNTGPINNEQSSELNNIQIDYEALITDKVFLKTKQNYSYDCQICFQTYVQKFECVQTDRKYHFQVLDPKTKHVCTTCLLELPNKCARIAHQRIHLHAAPFICPECGNVSASISNFYVHLSYTCFHFAKCMTTNCFVSQCSTVMKSNLLKIHYIKKHTKVIFKCVQCPIACFSAKALEIHIYNVHNIDILSGDTFYQCIPCCQRLVSEKNITQHFKDHLVNSEPRTVFCCPGCGESFKILTYFKKHIFRCKFYINSKYRKICPSDLYFNNCLTDISQMIKKSCKSCGKVFMHKVNKLQEYVLPMNCASCISEEQNMDSLPANYDKLPVVEENDIIPVGELNSDQSPTLSENNRNTNVQNLQSVFMFMRLANSDENINISKNTRGKITSKVSRKVERNNLKVIFKSRKKQKVSKNSSDKNCAMNAGVMIPEPSSNGNYICAKCSFESLEKSVFHQHIVLHRDISSTYQCMECGLCFVVRTSLSSHLLISHGIIDAETYISENKCYDETAAQEEDSKNRSSSPERVVNENQCYICLEQFDNTIDHDKHFRVHGMAFIKRQKLKPVEL